MARGCPAIFERLGHEMYCGEALYFGGEGWLGKRQRVWLTASIKVQETLNESEHHRRPPISHGPPLAALEAGFRAEFLHFVWADEVLALSEVCVALQQTARAARQAYIDLRWEQSLARIAQSLGTYDSDPGQPSPLPWPTSDDAPGPPWTHTSQHRRPHSHSRSRSPRRWPRAHVGPLCLRDRVRHPDTPDALTYNAALV